MCALSRCYAGINVLINTSYHCHVTFLDIGKGFEAAPHQILLLLGLRPSTKMFPSIAEACCPAALNPTNLGGTVLGPIYRAALPGHRKVDMRKSEQRRVDGSSHVRELGASIKIWGKGQIHLKLNTVQGAPIVGSSIPKRIGVHPRISNIFVAVRTKKNKNISISL